MCGEKASDDHIRADHMRNDSSRRSQRLGFGEKSLWVRIRGMARRTRTIVIVRREERKCELDRDLMCTDW